MTKQHNYWSCTDVAKAEQTIFKCEIKNSREWVDHGRHRGFVPRADVVKVQHALHGAGLHAPDNGLGLLPEESGGFGCTKSADKSQESGLSTATSTWTSSNQSTRRPEVVVLGGGGRGVRGWAIRETTGALRGKELTMTQQGGGRTETFTHSSIHCSPSLRAATLH